MFFYKISLSNREDCERKILSSAALLRNVISDAYDISDVHLRLPRTFWTSTCLLNRPLRRRKTPAFSSHGLDTPSSDANYQTVFESRQAHNVDIIFFIRLTSHDKSENLTRRGCADASVTLLFTYIFMERLAYLALLFTLASPPTTWK